MKNFKPDHPSVIRHEPRMRDFEPAHGDGNLIEAIGNHIERHVGHVDMVFHEIVSDMIHLDVHWVKPTAERPYHTLITSGMSERPMQVPDGYTGAKYAEVCTVLPRDWRMPGDAEKKAGEAAVERLYWPVRWLKNVARMPHEYETFIGYGHTVPNGDPAEPFADDVDFSCVMMSIPYCFSKDFFTLAYGDREICFLSMVPLFTEETSLKLKRGAEALEDRWDKAGIPPHAMFDAGRKNVGKKGLFGLF